MSNEPTKTCKKKRGKKDRAVAEMLTARRRAKRMAREAERQRLCAMARVACPKARDISRCVRRLRAAA